MIQYMKESVRSLKAYSLPNEAIEVKLDANENPFNLFEQLQEKYIQEISAIKINRYPDAGCFELKALIADYAKMHQENIICGNGSDELIQLIINTFVDKEEFVVTHTPTFSMYKVFTTIAGGKILEIATDDNFEVNIAEIVKAANSNKAKMIILCNPNNPTGNIIDREDIIYILNNTEALVIVDEAYYEFYGETVVDLVNNYERLIILRTLSKGFGLAGARIGYGIAAKNTMALLYKVKAPYNLNTFSQIAGKVYLNNLVLINKSIQMIKAERTFLADELAKIPEIKLFPSSANFLLIKTDKADAIISICKESGVSLRDFGSEGLLKNCIRITVGTREENKKLVELLRKAVE